MERAEFLRIFPLCDGPGGHNARPEVGLDRRARLWRQGTSVGSTAGITSGRQPWSRGFRSEFCFYDESDGTLLMGWCGWFAGGSLPSSLSESESVDRLIAQSRAASSALTVSGSNSR